MAAIEKFKKDFGIGGKSYRPLKGKAVFWFDGLGDLGLEHGSPVLGRVTALGDLRCASRKILSQRLPKLTAGFCLTFGEYCDRGGLYSELFLGGKK
jgi:hypothetical protein